MTIVFVAQQGDWGIYYMLCILYHFTSAFMCTSYISWIAI